MRPFLTLWLPLFPLWASPLTAQRGAIFPSEILRIEDRRAPVDADLAGLRATLSHRDPRVISLGSRALGRLERPLIIPWLLPLLAHPEPVMRAAAAEAVAQAAQGFQRDTSAPSGRRVALESLAQRVSREEDSTVRAALALSLGRWPSRTAEEIRTTREHLLLLAGRIGLDGPGSRAAARGLEMLVRGTWRQLPLDDALVTHLVAVVSGSRDEPTRRHALGALLVAQRADSRPVSLLLGSEDAQSRRLALTGLAGFPAGVERDRLRDLGLNDPSPMVRIEALRATARMDSSAGCGRLATAAVRDSALAVALLAIDLLASCDSAAIAQLLSALTPRPGEDWHRAAHGLVSLARLAPGQARARVAQASKATVWQLRMYAARAAGQLRDTATLLGLARDREPNVREAAIAALVTVMGHAADSVYRRQLGSSDYQLVLGAAGALAGSPAPDAAVPVLLAALRGITLRREETSRDARIALLTRLRELGTARHAPTLLPYLRDFDAVVADSTAAILRAWTGGDRRAAPRPIPPAVVTPAEVAALSGKVFRVTMVSSRQFDVELFLDEAPLTVARLARLVRRRYFDGLTFHRIVPNFVIQGGSPGANEYAGDGPFMRDELSSLSHERGTLGMSTRGRDTGDGQIFVNLVDNPRLDFDYTVWGRVIGSAGLAVVDAVREGDRIGRIEIRPRAIGGSVPAPAALAQGIRSADTAALMATVRVLAADSMEGRKAGSPGGARAAAYLARRLTALGIAPLGQGYRQPVILPRNTGTGANLLGVIRGTRFPGRYIVLSAHYDHVGVRAGQIYNGADDNASGTAAVLALAATLRQTPLDHSVIVALLDAEEIGSPGAQTFLDAGLVARDSIVLNVNLDMVGHSETGELWAAGSAHTPSLRPVLDSVAAVAPVRLRRGHDRAGVAGEEDWTGSSDHRVFHRARIPFVYFGVEDHQDYHTPSDDPATLTPAFFGNAVGTILAAIRKLDRAVGVP